MKKEAIVYLSFLTAITGCICLEVFGILKEERLTTAQHPIPLLEAIVFEINGDIYFKEGEVPMLTVEGPETMLEELDIAIEGSKVTISSNTMFLIDGWKNTFFGSSSELNIYITHPEVEALRIAGMGGLFSNKQRSIRELHIESFGLGEIVIENDNASGELNSGAPALLTRLLHIPLLH